MHPNEQRLTDFYSAFARREPAPMRAAYAPDAHFHDPVFPHLQGPAIGDMWTMLCEVAQDFSLEFRDVQADDATGSAHWEARYRFGGKRWVTNRIDARFTFRDGNIVEHTDVFDFHLWSRQALGPLGALLGWTSFLQRTVQGQSAKTLARWQAKKAR